MADGETEQVTIPVLLDAIRNFDDTPMARCVYVVAEADEPRAGWTLDLKNARVPFVMAGLSAVLYRGIAGEERFEDPAAIEALFEAVEADPALSVQTSDFWLPVFAMAGDRELSSLARGQVFRVGSELFTLAQRFVREQVSQEAFIEAARELGAQVDPSPVEAQAFNAWNQQQIEMAKAEYPKSRALKLEYR